MKVVILAAGFGTRLSEETRFKPKPLVEIGEQPILWHIMKIYSHYGFNEFIICLGYKGFMIKEYFYSYFLHKCDLTLDLKTQAMEIHHSRIEPWKVTLADTGTNTKTGGIIKKIQPYVEDKTFMLTYGDGVSDIDIRALVEYHYLQGKIATVTAVQPAGRFGALPLRADDSVESFQEKPDGDGAWINAGFFVLEPEVFSYIRHEQTIFEREPLQRLAQANQLQAFKHNGFWQPMDTLYEKNLLEGLWSSGRAPWKVW